MNCRNQNAPRHLLPNEPANAGTHLKEDGSEECKSRYELLLEPVYREKDQLRDRSLLKSPYMMQPVGSGVKMQSVAQWEGCRYGESIVATVWSCGGGGWYGSSRHSGGHLPLDSDRGVPVQHRDNVNRESQF